MEPVPILFGLGCLISILCARAGDARYMAWLCTAGWAISNIGWIHDALYVMPAFDALVAMIALNLWLFERTGWKAHFLALATAQVVLHLVNAITHDAYFVLYIHMLNATLAAQLIVIGGTGGVSINALDRFLRFCGMGVAHDPASGR